MSYPPPPGTSSSLPPRPPPSIHPSTHAFAGFKPRQVASNPATVGAPPTYSGVPGVSNQTSYGGRPQQSAPGYGYEAQASYSAPQTMYSAGPTISSAAYVSQSQQQFGQNQHQPQQQPQQHHQGERHHGGHRNYNNNNNNSRPHHHNNNPSYPPLDPEMEAQIAEQQSIYDPARRAVLSTASNPTTASAGYDPNASVLPDGAAPVQANPNQKKATVIRSGGGQTWKDDTLLEWDPAHFRLFVGNLAGEVTDESLLKAFAAYPSVKKARVIRDKRTTKSKGYGFVAFEDGDDYFLAAREMQGKYIGSHPVLLRKSNTEIRATIPGNKKNKGKYDKNKQHGASGGGVLGKKEGSGIVKKKDKGPKLLG